VPVYVVPGRERKAEIVLGEAILPERFSGFDKERGVYQMTCQLFRDFEKQLRSDPYHWIYWNVVSSSPRFDRRAEHDPAVVQREIRRILMETPSLLDKVPALRAALHEPSLAA
jgi:hypothetical protein